MSGEGAPPGGAAKRAILARRARFVAVALAGTAATSEAACRPCLEISPPPDAAVTAPSAPTVCLSIVQPPPPTAAGDAGAGLAPADPRLGGCQPDDPLCVPRVPPAATPCLSAPRPRDAGRPACNPNDPLCP